MKVMSSIRLVLLSTFFMFSSYSEAKTSELEKCYGQPLPESFQGIRYVAEDKPVVIISVDGGGVRGIIPIVMINEIEQKLGKSITKIGNVFAGTSVGSIIIGLLNASDENGEARYSAQEGLQESVTVIKDLFQNPLKRTIRTLGGLIGAKYSAKPLEFHLKRLLGENTNIANTINPIVITSVDMKTDKPVLFTTFDSLKDPLKFNVPLWMAIRASTAAPTFFKPLGVEMRDKSTYALGDGGLVSNNPEALGLAYAKLLYPNHKKFVVISLSTGKPLKNKSIRTKGNRAGSLIRMLLPTIDSALDAQSHLSAQTMRLLTESTSDVAYYRIDVTIPEKCQKLDNASDSNLNCLINAGISRTQQEDFKEMIQTLKQATES